MLPNEYTLSNMHDFSCHSHVALITLITLRYQALLLITSSVSLGRLDTTQV